MNQDLVAAIERNLQVEFTYDERLRIVEPHIYGVRCGSEQLFAFQVGGGSNSGEIGDWRTFKLESIKELKLTKTKIAGPRDGNQHGNWDIVHARIEFPCQSGHD